MSTTKNACHTQGPWSCHGVKPYSMTDDGIQIHLEKPYRCWAVEQIVNMPDGGRITTIIAEVVRCGDMSDDEMAANARLIAAAPEMLEMLKAVLGILTAKQRERQFPNIYRKSCVLIGKIETIVRRVI